MKVLFYRRGFGITQKEMANRLGITRETLGKKERGQSNFTRDEMNSYTTVLQEFQPSLTVSDIFFNQ